jgi:hypothetical protein
MLPLLNRNQGDVAAGAGGARGIHRAATGDRARRASRDRGGDGARPLGPAGADGYDTSTHDLARRNLDVVRQTFELGRATVYDVLAEQRRYLEFEQAYTAALLEAWEAHADLRRAVGE